MFAIRGLNLTFLLVTISILSACTSARIEPSIDNAKNAMYLNETDYLNFSHPRVQRAINESTANATTSKEKAVAIHNYVRDNIAFGFSRQFYDMTASEVLNAGRGFCNNQSTVFSAMLRGAGIPARHRFYSLSSQVLEGILNTGGQYVDHAVVEVKVDDKWIPVDSYIVDRPLARAVMPTMSEGLSLGMRADASSEWDGINPSFSQFHPDYVDQEYGVFEDVGDFYQNSDNPNNRFGFIEKLVFPFASRSANKTIDDLRKATP